MALLQKHGSPQLTGSYALDLMYGPDMDIVVVTDNPQQVSKKVLMEALDRGFFQLYEYSDFVRFSYPNRPRGDILVLRITVDGVIGKVKYGFCMRYQNQKWRYWNLFVKNCQLCDFPFNINVTKSSTDTLNPRF